ncbi:MAG: tyrosine-type recombinase/integrase [Planctomycetota bacterium]
MNVSSRDRPLWTRWSRKAGGQKICPKCKHHHNPVVKVLGKAQRPKVCVKCEAELPVKLTYPKKSARTWFVRTFDPRTGKQTDHPADSSSHADAMIEKFKNTWTADPVLERVTKYVLALIGQIEADTDDAAVNALIGKLGGDASSRSLRPVTWDDARKIIANEMREKGKSEIYILDLLRATDDLRIITGLTDWTHLDLEAIGKYRSARMTGGWHRADGRPVKAVGGRAVNKALATLAAFLARCVRKGWITRNILEKQPDERIKVPSIRVEYMPNADLAKLIDATAGSWLQAFIIVSYYCGARRNDILALEWDRDIDLEGTKAVAEGRTGPHVYVRGTKADTPHWCPLHPAAVKALRDLRAQPVIDKAVFPVRGSLNAPSYVSHLFAQACLRAGLTETVERDGRVRVKNRWSLHDLRRKATTDLRNAGASPKERQTIIGQRTQSVGEQHYEAMQPARERALIDGLPVFGMMTA